MTAQVYRFYNDGGRDDLNYQFSIVASEDEASYVVPIGRPDLSSVFNQERVSNHANDLLRNNEPLPDNSLDWALLLAYNINRALFPIDGETSFSIDALIEDEQKYADDTFKKYEDILGKGDM
jgi:hypothetical protein